MNLYSARAETGDDDYDGARLDGGPRGREGLRALIYPMRSRVEGVVALDHVLTDGLLGHTFSAAVQPEFAVGIDMSRGRLATA
jgi:hypothetical protein